MGIIAKGLGRRLLLPGGLVLLTSLVILVGSIGQDSSAHLEDSVLIEKFLEHRQDFDRLFAMAQHEASITRVAIDASLPDRLDAAGKRRVEEYRALLRSVAPNGVIEISNDHKVVSLTVTAIGFVTHNSQKGYLYSEEMPKSSELYPSLDRFSKDGVGNGYRHISGNWYLFFTGY